MSTSEPPPLPDPFWSPVHRRHPDVDLVVLPPERPATDPGPVDEDAVASALVRVATTARQLWSAIAQSGGEPGGAGDEPVVRWAYAADEGTVRGTARVVGRRDDGFPMLVTLRHELESDGWDVVRPPGAVERLLADLDELAVSASYAERSDQPGVFVLSVETAPFAVGRERARALVRGGREGRDA